MTQKLSIEVRDALPFIQLTSQAWAACLDGVEDGIDTHDDHYDLLCRIVREREAQLQTGELVTGAALKKLVVDDLSILASGYNTFGERLAFLRRADPEGAPDVDYLLSHIPLMLADIARMRSKLRPGDKQYKRFGGPARLPTRPIGRFAPYFRRAGRKGANVAMPTIWCRYEAAPKPVIPILKLTPPDSEAVADVKPVFDISYSLPSSSYLTVHKRRHVR